MIADILLVITGLLGLFISSITDLKTREVPDFVSYSMIFIGFAIRLMHSLATNDWNYSLYGLIGFVVMFVFGTLMYYGRQWGGGDTKLLMGLGVIFATKPYFVRSEFNFLLILFINILIIGAIYGLLWSAVLAVKHRNAFGKEVKKLWRERTVKKKLAIFTGMAIVLFAIFFISFDIRMRLIFGILTVFVAMYPYLYIVVKAVENVCMYKEIPISKLTEGDWIVNAAIKKKYSIAEIGIEKKQIEMIKKSKLKKVTVKEGIPFVPCFFLGLILTLLFSNIFFLF